MRLYWGHTVGTLIQQPVELTALLFRLHSSIAPSSSHCLSLSSSSDLSVGLFSNMVRGDEACRLDSAAGEEKKTSAPFIVTCVCVRCVFGVLVAVQYASHCTLLTGCVHLFVCVCVSCLRAASKGLFIYLFLADHRNRKRKAEGKEKGTEAGSISGFLCVHSARLCVCVCGCKERETGLVSGDVSQLWCSAGAHRNVAFGSRKSCRLKAMGAGVSSSNITAASAELGRWW